MYLNLNAKLLWLDLDTFIVVDGSLETSRVCLKGYTEPVSDVTEAHKRHLAVYFDKASMKRLG